jgi:hypothetical protein
VYVETTWVLGPSTSTFQGLSLGKIEHPAICVPTPTIPPGTPPTTPELPPVEPPAAPLDEDDEVVEAAPEEEAALLPTVARPLEEAALADDDEPPMLVAELLLEVPPLDPHPSIEPSTAAARPIPTCPKTPRFMSPSLWRAHSPASYGTTA